MRLFNKKRLGFFAAAAMAAIIIARPQLSADAARRAMALWADSVAPALFPFMCLMPLLTGEAACAAYDALFSRAMRLLGLRGSAASAIAVGMIAGSPAGAIASRRIAAESGMTIGELNRLAPAICGVSPAFLIGMAENLFGDFALGVRLALAQAAAQIILLVLLRFCTEDDPRTVPRMVGRQDAPVRDAVAAILTVCGYMVVFSVIAAAASEIFGGAVGSGILVICDISGGMNVLARSEFALRDLALGGAVGLSGLCICAQNLDALRGCGVKTGRFLLIKGMCACLCGAIAGILPRMDMDACGGAYAYSMLIALLCAVPCLIHVTMPYFFNRTKSAPNGQKMPL